MQREVRSRQVSREDLRVADHQATKVVIQSQFHPSITLWMPLASLWSSLSLLTPRPAAPFLRRATFSSWLLGGPIRLCGARSKAAYRNAIPHHDLPTPPQRLNVPQVSTTSPGRHHRTITLTTTRHHPNTAPWPQTTTTPTTTPGNQRMTLQRQGREPNHDTGRQRTGPGRDTKRRHQELAKTTAPDHESGPRHRRTRPSRGTERRPQKKRRNHNTKPQH